MVVPADVHRSSLLCCVVVVLANACHSDMPPTVKTAARLPEHVLDQAATGTRIATLPRPTTGVVRLTLFVDAGSRDAVPAQTASLAAWIAAANGGPGIEANVYPDVSELALSCTTEALPRCIDQLARTLATRDPSQTALSRAHLRLRDTQRRALAHDPLHTLDTLALRALLGDAARGFFPLGSPSDESTENVTKFLRDHYGAARSLLVAAGDVEPARVREAVAHSFSRLPRAALLRAARQLQPASEPRLLVSFDNQAAVAIAIAGHDQTQVQGIVASLATTLGRSEPRVELGGYVFEARGGALAMLRARGGDIELALDRAVRELARLKFEPPDPAAREVVPDDLINSTRRFGMSFGSQGNFALGDFVFSAALQLDAGPGAGPRGQDSTANTEKNRTEHAQSVFARALAQAQPHTHGETDDYGAAVVTDNGARIDVQFAQDPDVAIAVRVAFGAEQDPPLLHGQSALLATLTGWACAGMGPELLRSRLARLGASMEPRVDPESYGLLLRVPKQNWQEGLDLALRCMRTPSRDAPHFADAALQLHARLRKRGGLLGYRARAAALIAPRAPGQCAPWGDPARIGNLNSRELDAAFRQTQSAARWAIGIAGTVPVHEAVERSARRIADLATGSRAAAVDPGQLPTSLQAEAPRATNTSGANVVVTWTARGKFQHRLGGQLFVRALAALLAAVPGVEVLWQDADLQADLGFAALALRMRPDVAPMLTAMLTSATQSLDDRFVEKAVGPAVTIARDGQIAGEAQLAVRADHVARMRLGATFAEPTAADAQRLMKALRDVQPRWAVSP